MLQTENFKQRLIESSRTAWQTSVQEEIQQNVEQKFSNDPWTDLFLFKTCSHKRNNGRPEQRDEASKLAILPWRQATAVLCNSPRKVLTDEWRIFLLLNPVICCFHLAVAQRPRINVLPFHDRFSRQLCKVCLGKLWLHYWKYPAQGSVGKSSASRLLNLGFFWYTESIVMVWMVLFFK